MRASEHAYAFESHDILRLTPRQHLQLYVKSAGVMETVCVTGNQALVYFEWAKQGGPLRSMRREMPVGLTERSTSVPYRLLNNWMWYLTLWDCPGVAVAIPDMKCRAADALFSTRLSSSSGNEKTTGMQGKEGRGSWQALGNQSHETHHTSAAPSKISNFI